MRRIGATTTQNCRFEIASTRNMSAKRLLIVMLATLAGAGMLALFGHTAVVKSRALNTVQAAARANNYFHFKDGQEMHVAYRGEQSLISALNSGAAQARSIASIDFDRDGTPDVVAGYSYNGAGMLAIQHGNPDAFAPKDDRVFPRLNQGYNPDSLLSTGEAFEVPESVDFLQVGDFNHDNNPDVLFAAQGGGLFLLAGDGEGGLGAAEPISLSGAVTCMKAGEFRAPDGYTDVAVGVNGPSGPELLIFDGVNGLGSEPMTWSLSAPATALEFGEMDATPFHGLAVATGNQVEVIHGWGRKQNPTLASRVETIDAGGDVRGVASGFFVWTREANAQLAALTDDGTIHILERGHANVQPFTDEEIQERARLRLRQTKSDVDIETVSSWQAAGSEQWTKLQEIPTDNADGLLPNSLQRGHISFMSTDDLLILGGASRQRLDVVRQFDAKAGAQRNIQTIAGDMVTTRLNTGVTTAGVMALPQKLNGERDLLMLQSGSAAPTVVPLVVTATILVDRTDDTAAASACTAAAS